MPWLVGEAVASRSIAKDMERSFFIDGAKVVDFVFFQYGFVCFGRIVFTFFHSTRKYPAF